MEKIIKNILLGKFNTNRLPASVSSLLRYVYSEDYTQLFKLINRFPDYYDIDLVKNLTELENTKWSTISKIDKCKLILKISIEEQFIDLIGYNNLSMLIEYGLLSNSDAFITGFLGEIKNITIVCDKHMIKTYKNGIYKWYIHEKIWKSFRIKKNCISYCQNY